MTRKLKPEEWKIITVSNYDLESYRQTLIADHITSQYHGEIMLKALQNTVHRGDSTYYHLVPRNKALWLGMEEFADTICTSCGEDLYGKRCCI